MQAVFFEVQPHPGHMGHYFEHVDRLRPVLTQHDGMVWIDRFRPIGRDDALLSHQLWRDETAIAGWRLDPNHKVSQSAGRHRHFAQYRIRVAALVGHSEHGAPPQMETYADIATDNFLLVSHLNQAPASDGFESVNRTGAFLTMQDLVGADAARAALNAQRHAPCVVSCNLFHVHRYYGLHDRAQAPTP